MSKQSKAIKLLTRVSIFGAIATVLYVVPGFQFKLPIFPVFLEIHLSEIPSFIAGFAYGPLTGALTIVVRTLIKLPFTSSMGVGELADLIYSLSFILPAAFFYKYYKKFWGACAGISIGFVAQLIISMIFNIYIILPFYSAFLGLPKEDILAMCQAINPLIQNLEWDYGLYVSLPFNALKNGIITVVVIPLYKPLKNVINKIDK